MPLPDLGLVVDSITALQLIGNVMLHSERVVRVLESCGLKPDAPPSDFDGIYIFTLVEYGAFKPKPVLDFFRDQIIRDAFQRSFEENNLSFLEREAISFLEWSEIGAKLQNLDYNPRQEFTEFQRVFTRAVARTRKPAESEDHHLLVGISESVESIRESLLANTLQSVLPSERHLSSLNLSELREDFAPLRPAYYASRRAFVGMLLDQLRDSVWLALIDSTGKGKTQLAYTLIAEAGYDRTKWLSLRNKEGEEAVKYFERQLVYWLSQILQNQQIPELYGQNQFGFLDAVTLLIRSEPDGALLVVDDLPDGLDNEVLYRHIVVLADAFSNSNFRLITTSQRTLPSHCYDVLGPRLSIANIPAFNVEDIVEILDAAQAPEDSKTPGWVSILLAHTSGHPALVLATVHWLKKSGWNQSDRLLNDLVSGTPTETVRAEQRRRMTSLISGPARSLLYRLTLVSTYFPQGLIQSVAAVQPQIEHVGECLDELLGPWVERLHNGQLEVTPLLNDAWKQNIDEPQQKNIHAAIAEYYLEEGRVSYTLLPNVFLHLQSSEQYEKGVQLLVRFMIDASTASKAKAIEWSIHLYQSPHEWPQELNKDTRVTLRVFQIRVSARLDQDIQLLNDDLEVMLDGSDVSPQARLLAYVNAGPVLTQIPADIALKRAFGAVRLVNEYQSFQSLPLEQLEEAVWVVIIQSKDVDIVRLFISEVEQLNDNIRQRIFSRELSREAPSIAIDRLWSVEADKSDEERNWELLLEYLNEVERVGHLPGADPFYVAAVRAKAIILTDHLGLSSEAIEILRNASEQTAKPGQYLLDYTEACVLNAIRDYENALRKFDLFATAPINDFQAYKLASKQLGLVIQLRLSNWQDARARFLDLYSNVDSTDTETIFEQLELIGELALFHWWAKKTKRSCGALYGVLRVLITQKVEEPRYREVFNKTGNVLGWLLSLVDSGHPPKQTLSGTEYAVVEPGFFVRRQYKLIDFTPVLGFSKVVLLSQLAMLAEGVMLPKMAWDLLGRVESLINQGERDFLFLMGRRYELMASIALSYDSWGTALRYGIMGIRRVAVYTLTRKSVADLSDTFSYEYDDTAWYLIPKETREFHEHQLFFTVFGPALSNVLGEALPSSAIAEMVSAWETELLQHKDNLDSYEFWVKMLASFRALTVSNVHDKTVPSNVEHRFFHFISLWVQSGKNTNKLVDSLSAQLSVLRYLAEVESLGKYMHVGFSRFLHRYWLTVAETRRFELNSPSIFHEALNAINPDANLNIAIEILRFASASVGISIPKDILDLFVKA